MLPNSPWRRFECRGKSGEVFGKSQPLPWIPGSPCDASRAHRPGTPWGRERSWQPAPKGSLLSLTHVVIVVSVNVRTTHARRASVWEACFFSKHPPFRTGGEGCDRMGGATPSFFFWAWCCTFVVCCGSPANNAKKQKNDHGGPAADHAPPLDPPPPKGKTGFREKLILDRVRYPTSRSSSHTITRDRCEGKTHKDRRRGREAGDG